MGSEILTSGSFFHSNTSSPYSCDDLTFVNFIITVAGYKFRDTIMLIIKTLLPTLHIVRCISKDDIAEMKD